MSARASHCDGVQTLAATVVADAPASAGFPVGISLFTGAMGWDLGMERGAGVRFRLAADSCAAARATIRANRPGTPVLADARVSAAQIRKAAGLSPDDVIDVVAGCPPCRAWSKAGRRRGVADPDGMLVPMFVDLAVELRPRIVAMENVIGLASAELGGERGGVLRLVVHELKRNGYRVAHDLLNAADFGSPQDRRRLILIACLDADPAMPEPTHSRDGANGLPRWRTLRDALEGMPERPCTFLPYPPGLLRCYAALKAGQDWHHLPPDLQRESRGGTGRFMGGTSFCRRLAWDRPCPTLTCEPTSKTVGRCHPDEDRPLSVEEYRRVQGFADNWIIRGSTAQQYSLVGNAVPVPLSTAVGRAVAMALGLTPPPPPRADRPIEIISPPAPRLSGDVSKKGDGVLTWLVRLPGDRCPFATPTCSKECYAKRNLNRHHNDRHERNRAFCDSDAFVEQMAEEVRRGAAKAGDTTVAVCLHGRGEFYSLPYLSKWREVMERTAGCSNLRYYVYTRAWVNDRFRSELEAMARAVPNVRINLSADKDNARGHGIPGRIGDGLVTWLATTDADLPPTGAAVDLVLRSTRQRGLPPAEALGVFRVCPNESRLFFSRRNGKVVIEDGAPVRITCGECRLCIDRSLSEWDRVKDRLRIDGGPAGGTPREPSVLPASAGAPSTVTFLDLFSGVGAGRKGFEDACRRLGIEPVCVGFGEIDGRATATYLRHYPGTRALGDIRLLATSKTIPACGVILAGFPCQDASMAGKRRGLSGDRGRLFFALADVIRAARPSAFLLENVKGLASLDGGRALRTVLGTLEGMGYAVRHAFLNSRDFGVPQNRPRVYIVGFRGGGAGFAFPAPGASSKRLRDVLEAGPVDPRHYLTEQYLAGIRAHKERHQAKGHGFGYRIVDPSTEVAATLVCGGMGRDGNLVIDTRIDRFPVLPRRKTPISTECVRRLTPVEWERLQGLPTEWTAGQADSHRYRQLGNAMTVPVIAAISRAVLAAIGRTGVAQAMSDGTARGRFATAA